MSSLGLPLLSPFSWAMKMATTKANQETTPAKNAGMLDETDLLNQWFCAQWPFLLQSPICNLRRGFEVSQ